MRLLITVLLSGLVLLAAAISRVRAQEAISQEEPTPSSVDEIITPIERAFVERIHRPGFFPWLKEQLKDTPPFFRDTKLDLNLRSFYFRRDKFDDSVSSAWAMGGALSYKSGWLLDWLVVGTTFYWSENLYGPRDKDGTLLLKPGQHGYTVFGQLYGRIKLFDEHILNLYRYEYNTPFIGKNDTRMTPNTFEGYTLQGAFGGKDGAPGFRYGAGYITKIKERNSDDFVWMSRDAGADVKRGVGVVGGTFTYGKFSLGAINYYSDDIINIFYTESKYSFPITKELGALLAFQFTDQRSVGQELLKHRSFATNQVGVKVDVSYGGAVFTLGHTNTLRRDDMQSPWATYPGYTGVQVQEFNRAEEQAVITKLSYDFSRLGLEGVSSYVLLVHGWGRINPSTKAGVPDENEFNLDLQWRPKWSFLNGFSARYRYSRVYQYQGPKENQDDFRVIINYDFPLL
ncbi:MAG TPA: OprD family outer membrane porin [Candidatus Binatia bacterium]|nr:OprD family outer membrane porin [Candidatus Binatia bacterium]